MSNKVSASTLGTGAVNEAVSAASSTKVGLVMIFFIVIVATRFTFRDNGYHNDRITADKRLMHAHNGENIQFSVIVCNHITCATYITNNKAKN